ncbi:Acetylcholinesterase [Gryllus bimaculatus]|nr:Acetylcholinesterase [Gryllus bimaculatus]
MPSASTILILCGSALSPWALQRDPLFVKRKVAEQTGCHGDLLDDDLAPCLRAKPLADLLAVRIDAPRFLPGFAPFVDGTVLAPPPSGPRPPPPSASAAAAASAARPACCWARPGAASRRRRAAPAGTSRGGTYSCASPPRVLLDAQRAVFLVFRTPKPSPPFVSSSPRALSQECPSPDLEYGLNESRRDRILRTYVRNAYFFHLNEIFSTLKNEYTDWERPVQNPLSVRDSTLEVLSDGHTAAPLVRVGYLHTLRGGRTYFLHFQHQSGERDFPQRQGSVRGEDVPYVLGLPLVNGQPFFPHNYTRQDAAVSRLLIHYLANFARKG